jgi:hypothetical protein
VVHYGPHRGAVYLIERIKLPSGWGAHIAWIEIENGKAVPRSRQVMYEDLTPIPGQDYSGVRTRTVRVGNRRT